MFSRWWGVILAFVAGSLIGLAIVQSAGNNGAKNEPPVVPPIVPNLPAGGPTGGGMNGSSAEGPSSSWPEVGIVDAVTNGLVDAVPESGGLQTMRLTLRVKGDRSLRVRVAKGTLFEPVRDIHAQRMVVVRGQTINAPAGREAEAEIDVACANMGLNVPKAGEPYRVVDEPVASALMQLTSLPEFETEPFGVKQYAVWTITDNPKPEDYPAIVYAGGSPLFVPGTVKYALRAEVRQRIGQLFAAAGIDANRYLLFWKGERNKDNGGVRPTRGANQDWPATWHTDDNPAVRAEALARLLRSSKEEKEKATAILIRQLGDGARVQRRSSLAGFTAPETEIPMTLGMTAAKALAESGHWRELLSAMKSSSVATRTSAAYGLRFGDFTAEPLLLEAATADDPTLRAVAGSGLVEMGWRKQLRVPTADNRRILAALAVLLEDPEEEVRRGVLHRMVSGPSCVKTPAADVLVPGATKAMRHDGWFEAVRLLQMIGTPDAVRALAETARDKNSPLRQSAMVSMSAVGGDLAEKTLRQMLAEISPTEPGAANQRRLIEQALDRALAKRRDDQRERERQEKTQQQRRTRAGR